MGASVQVNWNAAAAVAFLTVAFVVRAHRHAARRAWPVWTAALTGTHQALAQWLRASTGAHLHALDGTLRVAREDHGLGRVDEALHVIKQADEIAARHVHLLRAWLQRWADIAVALTTLAPAPPLPLASTCLAPVRRIALAQRVGQVVIPTRALRFEANVRLQRLALKLVGWSAAAATARAGQPDQLGNALDDLDATCSDLAALDAQAATTLEHLLLSLPTDPACRDVTGQRDAVAPSSGASS